ncbi:hypothetical protein ACFE04_019196 [Oxalis oulophora]
MEKFMGAMSKVSCNKKNSINNREESGWTMYLKDFSPKNDEVHYNIEEDEMYDYSSLSSTTLISGYSKRKLTIKTRINTKKGSTNKVILDDDLEDTASSPLATPKKGNTSTCTKRNYDEIGYLGRERDCTELKKRGLCLVPLSLVSNYFG